MQYHTHTHTPQVHMEVDHSTVFCLTGHRGGKKLSLSQSSIINHSHTLRQAGSQKQIRERSDLTSFLIQFKPGVIPDQV